MSDEPRLHESVWVAPGVQLYGTVEVAEGASLWPNAVVRAECQSVRVGRYTNLQDFSMVHVGFDHATEIGDYCSITHHATVHGAVIGDACLIGINATIMDGARIGAGSIVAGGAFVTEGKEFPPDSIIAGVPAKVIATRPSARENRLNAWIYARNACAYARGDHRVWAGDDHATWVREARARIAEDGDLEEPLVTG